MLVIDSVWAVFIWPPLGLVMGALIALASDERSLLVLGGYLIAGLLGTSAGGVLTYLFTYRQPLLGGFWTSIVTSVLGGLVFLALWKAWLDAQRSRPRPG